jgi:hypothetical protein
MNDRPKQPTPKELTDELLAFLERKFYPDEPVEFIKDRTRLLKWAVLWPASWLNAKGVTLPAARYKEIFLNIFMDALRFGATDKVRYRPAWLKMVIQSHFKHHGEKIYLEAKSARSLAEHVLLVAGRPASAPEADPVRELALANSLLRPTRKQGKLKGVKTTVNLELNL